MSVGKGFCGLIENANLTEADVIEFSKSLRDTKTAAWQRLQAVRAIEAYRNLVLKTEEPSLQHVRRTFSSIAVKEKADGPGADRLGIEDERHLIAWIDPAEPEIIQRMRRGLRVRRKALEIEWAHVGWVERFIKPTGCSDVTRLGERDILSAPSCRRRWFGLVSGWRTAWTWWRCTVFRWRLPRCCRCHRPAGSS